MRFILIVDHEKCNGCTYCMLVCSMKHKGIIQRGSSRIKVYKDEARALAIPMLCEHCDNPPCAEVCPTKAISKDPKLGAVLVNQDLCTGCGACVEVCPYSGVRLDPETGKALICDLCGGEPLCAKVCTVREAITWVEATPSALERKRRLAEARVEEFKRMMREGP
ncbi:4Fe-4S dicluster domain-containing protein [Candidatus Bathyarchaeota archaeon]|nr:MAG: 4Fe-4S dicluster domain-containing protein [Candidatus Bathyarchaeota archaeon]